MEKEKYANIQIVRIDVIDTKCGLFIQNVCCRRINRNRYDCMNNVLALETADAKPCFGGNIVHRLTKQTCTHTHI